MVNIKTLLDILVTLVALLGTAPVMAFLDRPVLVLFLLALPAGAWCDRSGRYPLPGPAAALAALVALSVYGLQITKAEVATPVVHALVLLLIIRLVSAKQGRDYLQIFVLAIFILAGSSLLSLEVGFVVYLVLLVFGVTLGLVLLTVFVTDPQLAMPRRDLLRLTRVALVMPIMSLLLMQLFFVILPRTQRPLWNFLNPTSQAVAGLAEEVSPGSYARISAVTRLAFRAETAELPAEQLYWRALVLNQPQGERWVRTTPPEEGSIQVEAGRPVHLVIYPEPRSDRYLITLDRPTLVSGIRNLQSSDQVFLSRSGLDHRFRFEVTAHPGADLRVGDSSQQAFYLTLPPRISARVRDAATRLAADHKDRAARLAALEQFFLAQGLSYATDDLPDGTDPLDSFLFEKRRGYCEFFASAYTIMARLAGIPARMVGGYYGGDYNVLGHYYAVSEDMAHVWVEVLSEEGRWRRIDPSQWAVNAATSLRERASSSSWQRLADSMNYFWVQAVVVFDFERQVDFLRETRNRLHGWRSPELALGSWVAGVAGLLLSGGVIVAWRRRARPLQERLLGSLRRRVRHRYGAGAAPANLSLSELAERLDNEACREFAQIYQGAVFRDRVLRPGEIVRLRVLLRRI